MRRPGVRVCLCALAALLLVSCGTPPSKEMDMAQGAIDAARAAGAEQYATTEYAAATTALQSAHDAVAAGDYRLALNHALESHEHAQNAARDTANTKARMRSDLERSLGELDARLMEARNALAAAEGARAPARQLREPAASLDQAEAQLQEARKGVAAGDYLAASAALDGNRERIDKALDAIAAVKTPQPSRRRR